MVFYNRMYQVYLLALFTTAVLCQQHDTQSNNGNPQTPDNQSEAYWGNWTDWSNCSKLCGGGITKKLRECIKSNNETNATCAGDHVKYEMCNIQDCPAGTPDFRMQQCAFYNNKPLKGIHYRWASYIHPAAECELKCMPKHRYFYISFKDRVLDGTRCNPFTLDVCVNGTCVPVGCDMRLHSNASLDMCGVCEGDNSTCVKKEKTYEMRTGAYDYVSVTTIPTGATNIKIEESGTTRMFIALRSNGKSLFNGDYTFSNPGKLKLHNSILNYQRTDSLNKVLIDGPIKNPLDVEVYVFGGTTNDVNVEYYVPASLNQSERDAEYAWISDDWSNCSKICATGNRRRRVDCVNKETKEKVRWFYCNKDEKPHQKENCNTQPCPAKWYISQWAPCSKTCGRGLRTRRVHCLQDIEGGNVNMLNFTECPGTPPKRVESCVESGTCPDWVVSTWSKCSQTCGNGIQTREVECVNLDDNSVEEYKCSVETKPDAQRICYSVPCGSKWVAGEWDECSSKCGPGISSRHVTCRTSRDVEVPDDYCDATKEPNHFKACLATGPCKPTWQASEWSKCSARCGRGRQIRTVTCSVARGNKFEIVNESNCNVEDKPELSRRCFSKKPCHSKYYVYKWGKCSTSCGTGYRLRKVRCYVDGRVDYLGRHCAKLLKPTSIQICRSAVPCEGEQPDTVTTTTSTTASSTSYGPPTESPAEVSSITGPILLHKGDNADYTCNVIGYPRPNVTWSLNGQPITNERFQVVDGGKRLVILVVLPEDEGELTCHAVNKFKSSTSSIQISVSSPPLVSVSPPSKTLKEGEPFVIKCNAEGSPLPRIQWMKGAFSFYGDNRRVILSTNRIIFKHAELFDSGVYKCAAFNAAGSASGRMRLIVESLPDTKTPLPDCFDNNVRANCAVVKKVVGVCEIPHYKRVCCETCSKK